MKLLDTFAGIGGFSYAAEKLVGGFETTQFIEINPFCQKVLNKHWSHVPIHDDITTFTATPGEFDIITGGFPCQDISVAGLQKGITKETRSGLFYELIRVIRMVRPSYVILENVAAILANGLDIVLGELSEAGYDAEWSIISASSLGAAHRRSRWWLIAYPCRNGLQREVRTKVSGETWHQKNCRRLNKDWRRYETEPTIHRTVDGISNRVDRLKALGNAVVPQVAAIPLQRVKTLHESLTTVDH